MTTNGLYAGRKICFGRTAIVNRGSNILEQLADGSP